MTEQTTAPDWRRYIGRCGGKSRLRRAEDRYFKRLADRVISRAVARWMEKYAPPEDARTHWVRTAQCLRCPSCGSDQFQLRSFEGVAYAYCRCRHGGHLWETRQ